MNNFIKRIISVFLAAVVFFSVVITNGFTVSAYKTDLSADGQCGEDMFWVFDSDSGFLFIHGTGAMYGYGSGESPFYANTAIKKVVIGTGISELCESAFAFCSELTETELPAGMKSISPNCFESCTKLSEVILPSDLEVIGDEAFYDCASLSHTELPETTVKIGASSFESSGLTAVKLPEGITKIGSMAFSDCTELTEALVYSTVSVIEEKTFSHCSSLCTVSFTGNVEFIDKAAFNGCDSLSEIYFGGTAEEWSAINIGSKNTSVLNAEKHFNCVGTHSHTYSEEITVPPTCTEDGIMTYACSCGDCFTRPVPAEHDWSDWQYFSPEQDMKTCGKCGQKEYRSRPAAGDKTVISMNLIEETAEYTVIGIRLDSGSFCGLDLTVASNTETVGQMLFFTETDYLSGFFNVIKRQGEYSSVFSSIKTGKLSYASTVPFTASTEDFLYFKCPKLSRKPTDKNDFELTVSYCYDESVNTINAETVNNLPEPSTHIHSYGITDYIPETCTEDGIRTYYCPECGDTYSESVPAAHKLIHKRIEASADKDGCEYDVCTVCYDVSNYKILYAPLINAINGAVIDEEKGIICGLCCNLTDIGLYTEAARSGVTVIADAGTIGTGTKISVFLNGINVKTYTAVIFGDVNGDGQHDGTDAMKVKLIYGGLLSQTEISEAERMAADCNHDGAINEEDVDILENAGLMLNGINQN